MAQRLGNEMAEVTRKMRIADAAAAVLSERIDAVRTLLPLAALEAEDDIEHVHQLRVATRRMAAGLIVFEPVLNAKQLARTRKMLKAIRRAAGDARESDVHTLEFAQRHHMADGQQQRILEELIRHMTRRRAKAQKAIRQALTQYPPARISKRASKLIDSIDINSEISVMTLEQLASKMMPELVAQLRHEGADLQTIDQLHELRITGKRVRYAVEVFGPCYDDARTTLKQFKRLQDALGRINDLHEVLVMLKTYRKGLRSKQKMRRRIAARGMTRSERVKSLKRLAAEYKHELGTEVDSFIACWNGGLWRECLEQLERTQHNRSDTGGGAAMNGHPGASSRSAETSSGGAPA